MEWLKSVPFYCVPLITADLLEGVSIRGSLSDFIVGGACGQYPDGIY